MSTFSGVSKLLVASVDLGYNEAQRHIREIDQEKRGEDALMAVKIFFCYAHEDELYLNKLKAYLRPLQRQELIDVWHDRDISAGTEWEREISQRLNEAKIILLLVSPDF